MVTFSVARMSSGAVTEVVDGVLPRLVILQTYCQIDNPISRVSCHVILAC